MLKQESGGKRFKDAEPFFGAGGGGPFSGFAARRLAPTDKSLRRSGQAAKTGEQGGGVASGKDQAVYFRFDQVVSGADGVGAQKRQASAEGLIYDDAPAVMPARGHENIGLREGFRELFRRVQPL